MNRAALKAELQQTGFGNTTSETTRQNNWLDAAYLWLWNARDPAGVLIDWSFKKADQVPLTVTGGAASPTMPADFGSVASIEDDQGTTLLELAPDMFDQIYAPAAAQGQSSPRPEVYKVVNRTIVFGPTPSASASFKISYNRRVCHLDAMAATVAGTLALDDDSPFWPDHHMLLVYHAALVGHSSNSNPFGVVFQQLRDDALQAMRADLEQDTPPAQTWGDGGWSGYGG